MKTKELIKLLEKYDPDSKVMITIPVRKDTHQYPFVEELKTVTYMEWNNSPDSPQLCTQYWYKPVTDRSL